MISMSWACGEDDPGQVWFRSFLPIGLLFANVRMVLQC
ncbi:hypothetical protein ACVJGD_003375 [Bradyrhizobium sp. USDA 10063]